MEARSLNIIQDTNFLVSLVYPSDSLHKNAVSMLKAISRAKRRIIIPEIVIIESSFILYLTGFTSQEVRIQINDFSMAENTIIVGQSPLGMLRYISANYNNLSAIGNGKIRGTNDYLITCLTKDMDGVLITADQKIVETCHENNIDCFDYSKKIELTRFEKMLSGAD